MNLTNFKKTISFVALVLSLSVGVQAFQPREAKALLLVEAATGGPVFINVPTVLLCVFLLPICLLDQKAPPSTAYSKQDLLDNGYSKDQVSTIERDQTVIMSALHDRHQSMVVEKTDTRATLAGALREIDPSVSDEYVDFVADMNHLR